jgi:serine/threonine protein kinase
VLRAVKVVYRPTFTEERPFQREFEGIKKIEAVSRAHPSQLALFHVGRNEAAGYFYYVMELADALPSWKFQVSSSEAANGNQVQTDDFKLESYIPHTLRHDLQSQGRLPAARVLEFGLALAEALGHLHALGLVHRDIKPSNIIFVKGRPKLADIGLVTDAGDARSIVGTEGYLAPEGPGTPPADIFALGKVLYEATTGMERREFPKLPPRLREWPDAGLVFELNEILLRACGKEATRYQSADQLRDDLALLQRGKSVRRAHQSEKRWRLVRQASVWLAIAAVVVTLIVYANRVWQSPSNPEATKRSANEFAQKEYDLGRRFYQMEDLEAAATSFAAAVKADPNFTLAQAALAATLSWGHSHPLTYDQFPHLSEALGIARRALAQDDNLSDAHMAVAWHAFIREKDWPAATRHFEKAIRCDPNNWEAHEWYGLFLTSIGRTSEAIGQIEMASRLGGSWPDVSSFSGQVLLAARRYAEAVEKFQKEEDMHPRSEKGGNNWQLARAAFWRDGTDEAIEKWLDAFYGTKEGWVADLKRVLHERGRTAFWNARLEAVRERSKDPLILAEACAMAGRTNEALNLLQQAYDEHHDFLVVRLKMDPEFDSLRAEPRFQALLKKLHLD